MTKCKASHSRNLCSAFHPSKCTHTAVSSERTNEHTHGIEGGREPSTFTLPPTVPAGTEIGTRNLWITVELCRTAQPITSKRSDIWANRVEAL